MRATLLLLALAATPAFAAESPALPDLDAIKTQVAARDLELFDVLFEQCAPDKMRALLAEDLEFYHDKGGVVRGADAFVADYAKQCKARQAPDAWRSRRSTVEGTIGFDPIPGFGALHTGEHVFHERQGDGPQELAGRARFANLWQLTDDGWKLSRVFSYAHAPASE